MIVHDSFQHGGMLMGKADKGFSLIELMVVVAIIGLLAAIAYPSYQESARKGARAEAKSAMLDVAQMEERYFTNYTTYVAYSTTPPTGFKNYAGGSSFGSRKYDLVVAAGDSGDILTSFTITATPANSFSDPTCGALTLKSDGTKSSEIAGTSCW